MKRFHKEFVLMRHGSRMHAGKALAKGNIFGYYLLWKRFISICRSMTPRHGGIRSKWSVIAWGSANEHAR
jgi:hypothetical protein